MSMPLVVSSTEIPSEAVDIANSSLSEEDADKKYHCTEVAEFIIRQNAKVVCLQFPDDIVCDSVLVAQCLKRHLRNGYHGASVHILADSSYSPCCVDSVAAQHINSDLVLHYGNACLTPVKGINVGYVLENKLVNSEKLAEFILKTSSEFETTIIYSDLQLHSVAQAAHASLNFQKYLLARPAQGIFIPHMDLAPNSTDKELIPNYVVQDHDVATTQVIWLTDSNVSDSLLLFLSTKYPEVKIIDVNNLSHSQSATSKLRQRYRIVMQAHSAGTIGVLVNTLGTASVLDDVQRLCQMIRAADKKHYVFVVGKPNVPKLANFEAIDIWTVLGCPLGGQILDSQEYYKPIATPYELTLALSDSWDGSWCFRFKSLGPEDEKSRADEDEPLYDMVTGQMTTKHNPLRALSLTDDPNGETAVQKTSNALRVRGTVSTAAQFLKTKSWRGLGTDIDQVESYKPEEFASLKKGRSGTARDYTVVE